jgi:hypothetical protein
MGWMRLPLKGFSRINKIREKIIYFYSLSVNYKVLPLCPIEIQRKYRNSCPAGIPAQNHVPVKISSGKRRKNKKSSGILSGTVFWAQKINS